MRTLAVTLILYLNAIFAAVHAVEIKVAVASNFMAVAQQLAQQFEQNTGHQVKLSFGSTGKHYVQILHGAPFDLFFAADSLRPQRLEAEGVALKGSRFTYAVGQLVLWSPDPDRVDPKGDALHSDDFRYLSIANPKLAPYGRAAQQLIEAKQLQQTLSGRMVRGENVGQAFQFVKSGNAELGLIAYAQVKQVRAAEQTEPTKESGSLWVVPQSLYSPIEQQAVQLTDHPIATAFAAFVRTPVALEIILSNGYRTAHVDR